MRDTAFTIVPVLFGPEPPLAYAPVLRPPWNWSALDALSREVATARTRAGIRAAISTIYAHPETAEV